MSENTLFFAQSYCDRHGTNMLLSNELIITPKKKKQHRADTTYMTVGCSTNKHNQCFSMKCNCDCHKRGQ